MERSPNLNYELLSTKREAMLYGEMNIEEGRATPVANKAEVSLGLKQFDESYLLSHENKMRAEEARTSLSGVTATFPYAEIVESYLQMGPDEQQLVHERTEGHLADDARRDKTVEPDERQGEYQELPATSQAIDRHLRSRRTAAQEQQDITSESSELMQALLDYPLEKGNINYTTTQGNTLSITKYGYVDEKTHENKQNIDLLITRPQGGQHQARVFAFNIRKAENGEVDMISTQGNYGPFLNFNKDATDNKWRFLETATGQDIQYSLENMQGATQAMERFTPEIKACTEFVRSTIADATETALQILRRAQNKPVYGDDLHVGIKEEQYTLSASERDGATDLNMAKGSAAYVLGYRSPNLHVSLNSEENRLEIKAITGNGTSKWPTHLSVNFHEVGSKLHIDSIACEDSEMLARTLHTQALPAINEMLTRAKDVYPMTLGDRARTLGKNVLRFLKKD